MFRSSRLLLLVTTALLAACTVGPDYQQPATSLPAGWVAANAIPDADGVQREWWKHFHDTILEQLIDRAVAGNPDIQIAEARIEEARAARDAAHADLLPKGDVKGEYERIKLPPGLDFPGLSNPLEVYQAGFDASWELDLFGGRRRAVEARTAEIQAQEATRDDTLVSLLAEIARDYIAIRTDQAQRQVTLDVAKSDQATLAIARQRFAVGQSPGLDVTQAEAQLQQANTQLPVIDNRIAQNAFALDVLLGANPGTAMQLVGAAGGIPLADGGFTLAAPAKVIDHRPDIRVAERRLAAATAERGVAVAQFYPDISLQGFIGQLSTASGSLLKSASRFYMLSATGTWNILDYGTLEADLHNAKAEEREALMQYRKTVVAALSDVERAVTAYDQQDIYRLAQVRVTAADQQAAKVARQRYKEGLTSFIEVLDAERTLYAAQIQSVQAQGQASANLVTVYKSLGGGWQPLAVPTPPAR